MELKKQSENTRQLQVLLGKYKRKMIQVLRENAKRKRVELMERVARNCINIGLPILECPEAVDNIKDGDIVSVNVDTGVVTNESTGKSFQAAPFPKFIQEIIACGGLVEAIKSGKYTDQE